MEWKKLICPERIRKSHQTTDDLRTEFEKDYHRIIGSASFRRLQDKTQVFPLDKSDFVRTRLTHSLEVSSFGKSLGQSVSKIIIRDKKDDSFLSEYSAHICDILQCAGLIHDIGNPPFGHFGEDVIKNWFRTNLANFNYKGKSVAEILKPEMLSDFYNFDGNAQGFRLVTKLHHIIDEHGMNLTKGLLSAIIKYPCSSYEADKHSLDIRRKKTGYFYADKDTYYEVDKACGTQGRRNPLALLLETADDIAYKTADIEDAFKKGLISFERLCEELGDDGAALQRYYRGNEYNAVQNWLIEVQRNALRAAAISFGENYDDIMSGSFNKTLIESGTMAKTMDSLDSIAYRHAFTTRPIYLLELGGESVLSFLLDKFVTALIDPSETDSIGERIIVLISENYINSYKFYSKDADETYKLYLRLMLAMDHISGMTDSYAQGLYRQMKGI